MLRYSSINLDNNGTLRDVYPSAVGSTTGQMASGAQDQTGAGRSGFLSAGSGEIEAAAIAGGSINPVVGGIIFFVMVFGLMVVAKRLGTDDDFKSLKPSIYNIVTIAFAAAAGLPLLKYAAVKAKIPGVSSWILAA